jgi:thioredoxin-related protein
LSIAIDRGSDEKVRKLVKDYVKSLKLTFLNLLDPKSESAAQYGVRGIPINFFIDTQGKVVAYASGYREWKSKEGRKVLEQLLSETSE